MPSKSKKESFSAVILVKLNQTKDRDARFIKYLWILELTIAVNTRSVFSSRS